LGFGLHAGGGVGDVEVFAAVAQAQQVSMAACAGSTLCESRAWITA